VLQAASKVLEAFIGDMHMSWQVFAGGLGWAVVLGLVTGAIPAWTALRLKIATALGRR
jgi:ABC-type antimicrobial peptide transport system permease subunit